MRKYAGILSLLFLLLGISSLFLGSQFKFFSDYLYQIMFLSYMLSWFLTLISKKSIWKTLSLIALILGSIVFIGFFLVMTLLWNRP